MPAHMQQGQQHAQRAQAGATGQRSHMGQAMPRPAAQPGQAPQPRPTGAAMAGASQPRPQNTRNTVVHHAPPMQLQVNPRTISRAHRYPWDHVSPTDTQRLNVCHRRASECMFLRCHIVS